MKDLNNELVDKILESLSKVVSLDKKRVFIHNDLKLHPSEIHLLIFIHDIQDENITKIANRLNLTKGAISQTLTRLYNKGIIIKKTDPFNKNQLRVQFTSKGKMLVMHLIEMKKNIENMYLAYIKTLSNKEKQVISDFLDEMISIMDAQHH